jgi:hypothetical protein
MQMDEMRMRDDDYKTLAKLEEAFEKKDLSFFKSFLETSKGSLSYYVFTQFACSSILETRNW